MQPSTRAWLVRNDQLDESASGTDARLGFLESSVIYRRAG
jgi:hypothetical protein